MENLSSDAYPLLSSCRPRGTFETNPAEEHKFNGLIAKDKLCYVDGSKFYIGDWGYEMGLTSGNVDRQKELVSMGAYVIILPDKKYINTINPQDRGNIEASWNHNGGITYAMCQLDGTDYTNVVLGENPRPSLITALIGLIARKRFMSCADGVRLPINGALYPPRILKLPRQT